MQILHTKHIAADENTTFTQHTDNLLSVNDTVKFMFIAQIAMYHYDMYVKVEYDNFNDKRRYDYDDDDDDDDDDDRTV